MSNMEPRDIPSSLSGAEVHCDYGKIYRGEVRDNTVVVWVEEGDLSGPTYESFSCTGDRELFRYVIEPDELDPYDDRSPELIECYESYYESGSRAFARILLTDALGDDVALARYKGFLYEVVNRLPKRWSMTLQHIRDFVAVGILPPCLDENS